MKQQEHHHSLTIHSTDTSITNTTMMCLVWFEGLTSTAHGMGGRCIDINGHGSLWNGSWLFCQTNARSIRKLTKLLKAHKVKKAQLLRRHQVQYERTKARVEAIEADELGLSVRWLYSRNSPKTLAKVLSTMGRELSSATTASKYCPTTRSLQECCAHLIEYFLHPNVRPSRISCKTRLLTRHAWIGCTERTMKKVSSC